MGSLLLVLIMVLVLAALVFGVVTLLSGDDPGLNAAEPDGRALPMPTNRSLAESDLKAVRFDTALRGYRMAQVDRALRRTAYDIGYKDEMIAVLEAEVAALREGRTEDAELLRKAREAASDTTEATAQPPALQLDETADEQFDGDVLTSADDVGGDEFGRGERGDWDGGTAYDSDGEPEAARGPVRAPESSGRHQAPDEPEVGVAEGGLEPSPPATSGDGRREGGLARRGTDLTIGPGPIIGTRPEDHDPPSANDGSEVPTKRSARA